jgi:hypothetical protein
MQPSVRLAKEVGALLGQNRLLFESLSPESEGWMKGSVQCVWFKRDLRVRDHEPLLRAAEHGPVAAIYLIEPAVVDAPDFDALHAFPTSGLHHKTANKEDLI